MIMPFRVHILTITFCLVLIAGPGAQESCPAGREVRQRLHEKPYFTLSFRQLIRSDVFETVDTVTGRLWTGSEGRFRLSMPGQIIVSNGLLLWSYSLENRQVLVDSIETLGRWDPLTLLYDPDAVYRCRAQREKNGKIELDMGAIDSLTVPHQFTLQISGRSRLPEKLTYRDDNGSLIEVALVDFDSRDRLPDSLFEFHPPPGVEIIRMP
jgi:outer membrane lipoprotein-sorting protein